jgi:hypothetical protein
VQAIDPSVGGAMMIVERVSMTCCAWADLAPIKIKMAMPTKSEKESSFFIRNNFRSWIGQATQGLTTAHIFFITKT